MLQVGRSPMDKRKVYNTIKHTVKMTNIVY